MKRQNIRVSVFDHEELGGGGWPPADALGFLNWFQGKIELVPVEYRDKTMIELSSVASYEDSNYARIEIYYDRPEIDEEMEERYARRELEKRNERERLARRLAALDRSDD